MSIRCVVLIGDKRDSAGAGGNCRCKSRGVNTEARECGGAGTCGRGAGTCGRGAGAGTWRRCGAALGALARAAVTLIPADLLYYPFVITILLVITRRHQIYYSVPSKSCSEIQTCANEANFDEFNVFFFKFYHSHPSTTTESRNSFIFSFVVLRHNHIDFTY